ncbi:FG-GAP-like repeat-containing protein [Chitinophaga sp. 30R24]|uniref:FG-GAP-like repeat-containing protein n=1 Tax=Chitinophaga sp. 30R24 TaxID=3248838 RepID=UPI003B922171
MRFIALSTLWALFTGAAFAQTAPRGLSFVPDYTFTGNSLDHWQQLGDASWHVQQGELAATVKEGHSGWLLLERSLQDVGFHALFKCSPDAAAGILFRIEKTADSLHGVLVSIKGESATAYRITLDAQGHETQRIPLRYAGSIVRLALPPKPVTTNNNQPARRPPAEGPVLPLTRPETALRSNDWNQVEVMLDADIIRTFLNDGREQGAATEEITGYGPIALYAGGSGTVAYKEIGIKDIAVRVLPEEKTSDRYHIQRINDMYYSWAATAADFNHDGYTDIAAGLNIFYGPDYTISREINPALTYNPSKEFTEINCEYSWDVNGDGWPDIINGTPRATVYLNPKGASRRWEKYEVIPAVQTEVTVFQDLDGDGKPELVYGADGYIRYAVPDPADPTKPWISHIVSEKGYSMGHGLGVGDINGDGRKDIVNAYGWWEQPAANKDHPWTYHPAVLGRYGHRATGVGGAVMAVYDVNGDHLNDVVTSLNAHGFGLAWFEQQRDAAGNISFKMHMISDDFASKNAGDVTISEIHGTTVADIDGDGVPDFIVGKRYWSHLDNHFDPDPYGAPVIYVYRTVRNVKAPGGAEFIPELVHNRSGAGSDILAADLNKDGAIDIITSTDRGTFIFWNKTGKHP